ncbi:hypothetical protein XNC1_1829 [Xenorhabdus nematophila ATCC 19061]|uniref:Uncharacterized protein n=1 Tax=Xenorhabdus nematophila (strain ATCC 19061 / DSM 3370 / CCUG 14189 / LMG 1036 / NCIMB 9965 / AN6) TaxID=406817 RepID=D3VD23_XENNA|nr:hypothetical protein XNC1_1829 [Xenorhabdus nematophila ATCC 19061]
MGAQALFFVSFSYAQSPLISGAKVKKETKKG